MKSSKSTYIVLIAALAITIPVSAQRSPNHQPKYTLIQIGTFGGPTSDYATGPASTLEQYFNSLGQTVGTAATTTADPFYPNCFFDCFVDHALKFQSGTLTDLGALPGNSGNNSSTGYGINASELIVGVSENGSIDPSTGYPEYHAVVWRGGVPTDLGTLGGSVSQAFAINSSGQVVGVAANAVPDQYASGLGPCATWNCWPVSTQQRAFLWEGGSLQDLGTLGGNDAVAYYVNEAGQVAGVSYTNTTPNPTTGVPTQHPFLWDGGRMLDLGTLGGTVGVVYAPVNHRGEVAGYSTLAGDEFNHAFLWDGAVLHDLGTLGGDASYATGLNDAGDVVGGAQIAGDQYHAFLWRQGVMTDLGVLSGEDDSYANAINATGQIVGGTYTSQGGPYTAFLWENGGPMVDLNTLVTPPSALHNLHLEYGYAIADDGKILAFGRLPSGDVRIALLAPHGD